MMNRDEIPVILVCGGREFLDKQFIYNSLDEICKSRKWCSTADDNENWIPRVKVVTGAARGVDTIASDWATINWLPLTEYPADWARYGLQAGRVRNQKMLDEEGVDLVVAFPGGRGTADMVWRAQQMGVEVLKLCPHYNLNITQQEEG